MKALNAAAMGLLWSISGKYLLRKTKQPQESYPVQNWFLIHSAIDSGDPRTALFLNWFRLISPFERNQSLTWKELRIILLDGQSDFPDHLLCVVCDLIQVPFVVDSDFLQIGEHLDVIVDGIRF